MTHAMHNDNRPALASTWRFESEADIVAGHLEQRAMQRRVMCGCALVGSIGVVILLMVLVGSSPNLDATSPFLV